MASVTRKPWRAMRRINVAGKSSSDGTAVPSQYCLSVRSLSSFISAGSFKTISRGDSLMHRQMVLKRQASDQTQQSCCSCSGNLNLGRIWEESRAVYSRFVHTRFERALQAISGLGPVHTAGGTANKMWMSRKFFLLPGIFPLKIENHFQKISQKNFAERSRFVIGSIQRF
jgi:hypothetical protein